MVESVEVIVVGHIMCDDLSVNDVALALLTGFVQCLVKETKCGLIACYFEEGINTEKYFELTVPASHWLWMFWGQGGWTVRWCT